MSNTSLAKNSVNKCRNKHNFGEMYSNKKKSINNQTYNMN